MKLYVLMPGPACRQSCGSASSGFRCCGMSGCCLGIFVVREIKSRLTDRYEYSAQTHVDLNTDVPTGMSSRLAGQSLQRKPLHNGDPTVVARFCNVRSGTVRSRCALCLARAGNCSGTGLGCCGARVHRAGRCGSKTRYARRVRVQGGFRTPEERGRSRSQFILGGYVTR